MTKNILQYLILALVLLMVSNPAKANTYYLSSSTGSDAYTISQAQNQSTPWKTISTLKLNMSNLRPGDKVLFKKGDTFLGNITITVSGTLGSPITFGSYGIGNKPIIDSRVTLTGWTSVGLNIWETSNGSLISMPAALMVDDVLKPLGRYPNITDPNGGYLNISSHPTGSKSVFTDNLLTGTPNWTGAEAVIRTEHWVINRLQVANHTGNTITLAANAQYELLNNFGYFFQNHPTTLDVDGEWCYSVSGNKIRIYSSMNPSTQVITVSNINYTIYGYSNTNIVIDGLKLIGSNKSAIQFNNASYLSIRNCEFTNSGMNDIQILPFWNFTASDSITIKNNTFSSSQCTSIYASGKNISITGNSFTNTATVPGMGQSGQNYCGISLFVDNGLIENNKITNTGYCAISFNWSKNITINQNLIDNFCTVIDDGAGIYCWTGGYPKGVNRKITNNIVLNGKGACYGTNTKTYLPAEGIYLDELSRNVEVTGNTVAFMANSGLYFHNSPTCSAQNNTIYSCKFFNLLLDDNSTPIFDSCKIQNNILVSSDLIPTGKLLRYRTADTLAVKKFGIINNNYYCQPFLRSDYINFFVSPQSVNKSLNLKEWTAQNGFDNQSFESPLQYTLQSSIISLNGITNGSFTSSTLGWNKYDPTGNLTTYSMVSGKLDGYCMSIKTVGTGAPFSSRMESSLPSITAGKTYLLKISAKGTKNGVINCQLNSGTSGFPINLSTNRIDKEMLFIASSSSTYPTLLLNFGPEIGVFYIDNVEFYEVIPSNISDFIRFEYNSTLTNRIIKSDKNYITPTGILYNLGSNIIIPPFSSIILLTNNQIINDVKTQEVEGHFKMFLSSSNNKLNIQSNEEYKKYSIAIFDINGRKVKQMDIIGSKIVDISLFKNGIYFVRIDNSPQINTFKFIKY